jgi:hypothetical protein
MAHRRPLAFVVPAALALAAGAAIGYAAGPGAPAEQLIAATSPGDTAPRFVTRFKQSASDRTKHKQVTKQCVTGEVAIAGSAQLRYPKSTPTPSRPVPLFVTESRPLPADEPSPTGWLVTADAIARYSRDWSVQVNVTCAAPPP